MHRYSRYNPRCKLSAKIRWNRLARLSLSSELEAIGIFATSGTPVAPKDEDDSLVNDAYYDPSDRGTTEANQFDVRISRIQTSGIAELANVLRLWANESSLRHINIRSYDGATYRIEFVEEDDLISTLKNARMIDALEQPAEINSVAKQINTFFLGV